MGARDPGALPGRRAAYRGALALEHLGLHGDPAGVPDWDRTKETVLVLGGKPPSAAAPSTAAATFLAAAQPSCDGEPTVAGVHLTASGFPKASAGGGTRTLSTPCAVPRGRHQANRCPGRGSFLASRPVLLRGVSYVGEALCRPSRQL